MAVEKPNYRSLASTPYYFGNYLNMAEHNVYLILTHISEKFDLLDAVNQESLKDAKIIKEWKQTSNPDRSQKISKALKKHFFWVEPLEITCEIHNRKEEENNPKNKKAMNKRFAPDLFVSALERLHQLRNYYSHYGSENKTVKEFDIQPLFDSAKNKILDRHKDVIKKEEDIAHLSSYQLYDSTSTIENWYSEKGLCYFICLFLDAKNANTFLKKISGFKRSMVPMEKATIACYTNYCPKLPEPKLESGDILLDMLSELDRCPKQLFNLFTDNDKDKFKSDVKEKDEFEQEHIVDKMDMKRNKDRFPYFAMRYFDETKTFPTLRFQLDLARLQKDYYKKEILKEEQDRYIFKPLHTFGRLQDFSLTSAPKEWKIYDVASKSHVINKDLISQFSPHYNVDNNMVTMKFVEKEPNWNDISEAIAIYQHNKKVKNDKVGERKKMQLNPEPDVIMSVHEMQNLFLYQHLFEKGWITTDVETAIKQFDGKFKQCCAAIKSGKIPALRGDSELMQKLKAEGQSINGKSLTLKVHQLINSELSKHLSKYGYQIDASELPKDLRRYLLGERNKDYRQTLLNTVQNQLEETFDIKRKCQNAIEAYKEIRDKEGRKKLPFRIGDAATYIAKDIIFYKPLNEEGGGKPNNLQYSFLQSKIAEFSSQKDTIKTYLEELGLIVLTDAPKKYAHPFLYKIVIDDCFGGFDFCLEYATKKIAWLRRVELKIKGNRDEQGLEESELKRKYEKFFKKEKKEVLQKDYQKVAAYLPRGFFNKAILEALLKNPEYDVAKGDNMVTCLRKLLKNDTQPLYDDYERIYKRTISNNEEITKGFTKNKDFIEEVLKIKDAIIRVDIELQDKIKEQTKAKKDRRTFRQKEAGFKEDITDLKKEKAGWEKYAAQIMDSEKTIRFTQSNDRALWLMVTDLAAKREKFQAKNEENHNIKIDFQNQSLSKIGFDQKENNIMTEFRSMEITVHGKQIQAELGLRLYGKFRRFAKDRRLQNLLKYFNAENVLLHRLESELDYFDLHRERIFEKIYEFEKSIKIKYGAEFEIFVKDKKSTMSSARQDEHYIAHYFYLSFLEEKNIWLPSDFDLGNASDVVEFRNKLEHNELPYSEKLQKRIAFDIASEKQQRETDDIQLEGNIITILAPVLTPKILVSIHEIYDLLQSQIQ